MRQITCLVIVLMLVGSVVLGQAQDAKPVPGAKLLRLQVYVTGLKNKIDALVESSKKEDIVFAEAFTFYLEQDDRLGKLVNPLAKAKDLFDKKKFKESAEEYTRVKEELSIIYGVLSEIRGYFKWPNRRSRPPVEIWPVLNYIFNNDIDTLKDHLKKTKVDFSKVKFNAELPLHYAVFLDRIDVVKLLIDKGANVNAVNKRGESNLFAAILRKNTDVAKLLLEHGADTNTVDENGKFALFLTVSYKDIEMAKLLLEKGADPNLRIRNNGSTRRNKQPRTCLANAVERRNKRYAPGKRKVSPVLMRRMIVERPRCTMLLGMAAKKSLNYLLPMVLMLICRITMVGLHCSMPL